MAKKQASLNDNRVNGTAKRGAVHASGRTALRFKEGSPNDTSTTRVRESGRLRTPMPATPKRKPVPPSLQTRAVGESTKEFIIRRRSNRSK